MFNLKHRISSDMVKTFGSASFMNYKEIKALNLDHETGYDYGISELAPIVGCFLDKNFNHRKLISLHAQGPGHLLTVAPTRAGKGTGQIVTNLLTWKGSAIVIDIKGENYAKTAGYRADKSTGLSQNVIKFAPFEENSANWNPLSSIRVAKTKRHDTKHEEEDVRYLVNLMVPPMASGDNLFWENSAKNILEGLLLYVATTELAHFEEKKLNLVKKRTMSEVRRLLTLNSSFFKELLKDMQKESERDFVRQAASGFERVFSGEGRVGASILAFALEQTSMWAYKRVDSVTNRIDGKSFSPSTSFNFKDLRDGNTTLYLIIPPEHLGEYRPLLRVIIGIAMRELRYSYKKDKNLPPVLFILDEFPQLGYMKPIEDALLYIAGYGVRYWFFVQDLSQLELHYPKTWRTFLANTISQSYFGVNDYATAKHVSDMTGMQTIIDKSYNANTNYSIADGNQHSIANSDGSSESTTINADGDESNTSGTNTSTTTTDTTSKTITRGIGMGASYRYVGRNLIMPDEVLRMQDGEQILFLKGRKPIRCSLYLYFKDENNLLKKSEIHPPESINFSG